jgi:hypothetical protein
MMEIEDLSAWTQDALSAEHFVRRCTDELLANPTLKRDAEASVLLRTVNLRAEKHVAAIEVLLESLDAQPSMVRRAVGTGLGTTLGWMERLPNRDLPQFVRDVYVALNYTASGYHFMYTSAEILEHRETSQLALRHLRDYTPAIRELSKLMAWAAALEMPFADWKSDERMQGIANALFASWSSEQPLFR